MFCQNCGQALPENSAFCPSCGNAVEGQDNLGASETPNARTPRQHKKKKRALAAGIIAGGAVILATVLIVVFALGTGTGNGKDPASTIKKCVEAFRVMDFETVLDSMTDFMVKDMADEYGLEPGSSRKLIAGAMKDKMKGYNIFEGFEFSDFENVRTIDKSHPDFEDLLEDLAYSINFDPNEYSIEAFAEVSFRMKISMMGMTQTVDTQGMCFKHNGLWYICNLGIHL